MNLDKLNAVGQKITAQLIAIRESVGAPLGDYAAKKDTIKIITGGDLQDLAIANPDKPIIINGKLHLVHIKDHLFYYKRDHDAEVAQPHRCFQNGRKVHFYQCHTLRTMKNQGREDRYYRNSRISNISQIDLADEKDVGTRLLWCKNCISVLFRTARQWGLNKKEIAMYGDARQLMDCVESLHRGDTDAMEKTRNFIRLETRR